MRGDKILLMPCPDSGHRPSGFGRLFVAQRIYRVGDCGPYRLPADS
jgi:hypothetical protein